MICWMPLDLPVGQRPLSKNISFNLHILVQTFKQYMSEAMSLNAGYWLNPQTGAFFQVDTHETWIRDPDNVKKIGLSQDYYDELMKLPVTDMDGVRRLAVKGGLVRTRQAKNTTTIQFEQPRNLVRDVLHAVADMLRQTVRDPYEQLWLNNLQTNDSMLITLADFLQKIKDGEQVMIYEVNRKPIPDIQNTPDLLERLAPAIKRITDRQAKSD